MTFKDSQTLVFDIGKTHVKVSILNKNGDELYRNRRSNRVMQTQPYHSYDVDGIWLWLKGQLSELTRQYQIAAISIATHGAAAALIDQRTQELLLPVMDYEFESYPDEYKNYESIRPPFEETGSPHFPAGLNLGRQLYWQSDLLSDQEKENAILLMYPQYWAWKLSGEVTTEVTSLGCHTDLWNVKTKSASSLLETLGLRDALPPFKKAWEPVGLIKENLATELGLNPDCAIYPGVHDSNAGYLPILRQPKTNRPTVVSTGTWSVIMDGNTDLETLDSSRDMLVNIDAEGSPLATARYMGGREFGLICEKLNTDIATTFVDEDIEAIIRSNTFILPSFASGSGPYPDHQGRIDFDGEVLPINGKAAATIYAALMLNNILKRLSPNSKQDILIEGSFAQNSVLCGLLAALNPERKVRTQNSGNGVTEGCFLLTHWEEALTEKNNPIVAPYRQDIFPNYAALWENKLIDMS
jgi:sugar (pentulose or hexulose) kinase